jgi:hypothetical protein
MPENASEPQEQGHTPLSTKPLRTLAEIQNDLSKPIPRRLLKSKTVGGQKILFLPWHTAVKFLDLFAYGWTYELPLIVPTPDRLVVTARINIPTSDCGIVWREATGQEEWTTTKYGDPSSNAESMGLRRAASKFGLGLGLYEAEHGGDAHSEAGNGSQRRSEGSRQGQGKGGNQNTGQRSFQEVRPEDIENPVYATEADQISKPQLGRIHALCKENGIADADLAAQACWPKHKDLIVGELSKRAASALMWAIENGEIVF